MTVILFGHFYPDKGVNPYPKWSLFFPYFVFRKFQNVNHIACTHKGKKEALLKITIHDIQPHAQTGLPRTKPTAGNL